MSHWDLLEAVHPELSVYYKKIKKMTRTPEEALAKLYFATPSYEEIFKDEMETIKFGEHTLQEIIIQKTRIKKKLYIKRTYYLFRWRI